MPSGSIAGVNIEGNLEILRVDVVPSTMSLKPRLIITVRFLVSRPAPPFSGKSVYLINPVADVFVGPGREESNWRIYVGTAIAEHQSIQLNSPPIEFKLYLDLDYYTLERMEQIREGDDLGIKIRLKGTIYAITNSGSRPGQIQIHDFPSDFLGIATKRVPKSEWAEDILSKTNLKFVRLVELPTVIPSEDTKEIAEYLEKAWRSFLRGEYDNTLKECRSALDLTSSLVKEKGFTKEEDVNGQTRKVPNWRALFEFDEVAKFVEDFFRKIRGTTWPGAHPGRNVSREDATLILTTTYALIYYITRRLEKKEEIS